MEKLVRDKIPDIIKANGQVPVVRTAYTDEEYAAYLKKKLLEEIEEFYCARDNLHRVEEMADLLEVINAIMGFYGLAAEEVELLRQKKFAQRGGFSKRIIWSDEK